MAELFFAGGAQEVGKNAVIYLTNNDTRTVIDYGLKLFSEELYPLEVSNVDATIISHAHLDHSGHVPFLFRKENPLVISTEPTRLISELLWYDNAKIMGEKLVYPRECIKRALKSFFELDYGKRFVLKDIAITLFDAGHILGSALVQIEDARKKLLYTCDFNNSDTRIHRGCRAIKADVLILESTYAQKDHLSRNEAEKQLVEKAEQVVGEGGLLILPAFAVGRTQELIAVLSRMDVEIFVAGMGNKINEIYLKHRELINDYDSFKKGMKKVRVIEGPRMRSKLMKDGGIIITTAGMLEGGPALNYILNSPNRAEVVFTGYCVEGTNGWLLQNKGVLKINGNEIKVDIPVSYIDFSAHAGRKGLFDFVNMVNPERVFCMHGDNCSGFAAELRDKGFDAIAPENGKSYKI